MKLSFKNGLQAQIAFSEVTNLADLFVFDQQRRLLTFNEAGLTILHNLTTERLAQLIYLTSIAKNLDELQLMLHNDD